MHFLSFYRTNLPSLPISFLTILGVRLHYTIGDANSYQVYKNLDNAEQVGCWAHVHRKFHDIGFTTGFTAQGVAKCNSMFEVERDLKNLEVNERQDQRTQQLKPLIDDFFKWLDTIGDCGSKLKEAVKYSRNQKDSLLKVLDDGRLELSNNLAERSIRPIAIGRKNYLFSTSEKGATANAIAYTLIETAKLNGIIPYAYLNYLFTHLPNTDFQRNPHLLEDFLPWVDTIKAHCTNKPPLSVSSLTA